MIALLHVIHRNCTRTPASSAPSSSSSVYPLPQDLVLKAFTEMKQTDSVKNEFLSLVLERSKHKPRLVIDQL